MEQHTIRVTGQTLKVLSFLLEKHPEPVSGADIINSKRILSGTLYPLLDRLATYGLLSSRWEDVDPSVVKRPRKRLYKMTADGVHRASQILQEHGIAIKSSPSRHNAPVEDG
ncbi:PadR family transcriptional regulator [Hyphomonas sp. UBA4494]